MPKFFVFFLISCLPFGANTQVLTPVSSTIDFGTIALTDNASSYQLRVRWNGQVIHDPQIIIVTQPAPAEFELSEFPTYTTVFVNVTTASSETTKVIGVAAVEQFTISNFDYVPVITTDALGAATVYLGATLTTSGSNSYTDGMYNLPLTLEVNF